MKKTIIIGIIIGLFLLNGCNHQEDVFINLTNNISLIVFSNETVGDSYFFKFTEKGHVNLINYSIDLTINNERCYRITCECAKNTTTPCMAYCMRCE